MKNSLPTKPRFSVNFYQFGFVCEDFIACSSHCCHKFYDSWVLCDCHCWLINMPKNRRMSECFTVKRIIIIIYTDITQGLQNVW